VIFIENYLNVNNTDIRKCVILLAKGNLNVTKSKRLIIH